MLPGGRGAAELDEGGVIAGAERGVGLGHEGEDDCGVGVELGAVQGSVAVAVLGEQLGGVNEDHRLDNGNVTCVRGSEVHRVSLRVLLLLQQVVGLATEVDEGGDVAVLKGGEALV